MSPGQGGGSGVLSDRQWAGECLDMGCLSRAKRKVECCRGWVLSDCADEGARISGALTSLSEVLSLGRSGMGVKTIYPAAALSGFES